MTRGQRVWFWVGTFALLAIVSAAFSLVTRGTLNGFTRGSFSTLIVICILEIARRISDPKEDD